MTPEFYHHDLIRPVTITTSSLPDWTINTAYTAQVQASGGNGSITFAVTSGAIPPNLLFSSNGSFSGTLTSAGTYSFTITASDGLTGGSVSQNYTVTIYQLATTTTSSLAQLDGQPSL